MLKLKSSAETYGYKSDVFKAPGVHWLHSYPPHLLSDSLPAFFHSAEHTRAPTAEEAGMLPKAYRGFLNVGLHIISPVPFHPHCVFLVYSWEVSAPLIMFRSPS